MGQGRSQHTERWTPLHIFTPVLSSNLARCSFFFYPEQPHCVAMVGRTLWLWQKLMCTGYLPGGKKSDQQWSSHAPLVRSERNMTRSFRVVKEQWGHNIWTGCQCLKDHTENEIEWTQQRFSAAWTMLIVDVDEEGKKEAFGTQHTQAGLRGHAIMGCKVRCLTKWLYFNLNA